MYKRTAVLRRSHVDQATVPSHKPNSVHSSMICAAGGMHNSCVCMSHTCRP